MPLTFSYPGCLPPPSTLSPPLILMAVHHPTISLLHPVTLPLLIFPPIFPPGCPQPPPIYSTPSWPPTPSSLPPLSWPTTPLRLLSRREHRKGQLDKFSGYPTSFSASFQTSFLVSFKTYRPKLNDLFSFSTFTYLLSPLSASSSPFRPQLPTGNKSTICQPFIADNDIRFAGGRRIIHLTTLISRQIIATWHTLIKVIII